MASWKQHWRKGKVMHRHWEVIRKWWGNCHLKKYQEEPSWEKKKVIQMQDPGFPRSPLQETMLGQLFPCSLWRELHRNRCLLCSLWKGPCQSKWKCPKGTVKDPTQEQFIPEGLKPMMKIYTRRGEKGREKGSREELLWSDSTICYSPYKVQGGSSKWKWRNKVELEQRSSRMVI